MQSMKIVALILSVQLASVNGRSGYATWYDVSAGLTACGQRFSNDDLVAAIAPSYWTHRNPNLDRVCQLRARVTNPANGKSVIVLTKDKCMGCNSGDIDLSPAAFRKLGRNLSDGRFPIKWDFA